MAKTIVCVARSSDFRAETRLVVTQPQTQTQTRQLHVPTQAAARRAVSVSVSFSSLHLLRRHHQQYSTKMDAALAKIFVSNAQWVKAVSAAEPGFFEQSAKGQSPKVRAITTTSLLPPRGVVGGGTFTLFMLTDGFLSCTIRTDPLARMLGLSRPRKCYNCLASRRYLCSPQYCEPSPPRRR
jgi:hypothetical protein